MQSSDLILISLLAEKTIHMILELIKSEHAGW